MKNNPDVEIKFSLRKLEQKTLILKQLRKIQNEILSNCAYHDKNLEIQLKRFEMLNVPQKEIDIVKTSSELRFKLSQEMLIEYEELLSKIKDTYGM